MESLATRAMLARLNITQWSARATDKKVTAKVHADHNASADAGQYQKRLISKNALAELGKIASEARAEHYARTRMWADDGARILSAAGYLAYADKMRDLRARYDAAADTFAAGYPEFVDNARLALNGMFNDSDYPAATAIRAKFSLSAHFLPVPTADDFRVTVSDETAAAIRADIEQRTRDAMAAGTRELFERIEARVRCMAEKLRAYKPASGRPGDKSEGVFRDSLVENVRELVALLPGLNVTGDAKLAAITERMSELCKWDAEQLRAFDGQRDAVAARAESILADVSDYLA